MKLLDVVGNRERWPMEAECQANYPSELLRVIRVLPPPFEFCSDFEFRQKNIASGMM